jgi:hypothetical protein
MRVLAIRHTRLAAIIPFKVKRICFELFLISYLITRLRGELNLDITSPNCCHSCCELTNHFGNGRIGCTATFMSLLRNKSPSTSCRSLHAAHCEIQNAASLGLLYPAESNALRSANRRVRKYHRFLRMPCEIAVFTTSIDIRRKVLDGDLRADRVGADDEAALPAQLD